MHPEKGQMASETAAASADRGQQARVDRIEVSAYRIPTDAPESDGTLEWDSTTLILVQAAGCGKTGLGYSYSHQAVAALIDDVLAPRVQALDAMAVTKSWTTMRQAVRNLGRPGIAS